MKSTSTLFQELIKTIETLRSPKGCPWDQKQTLATLKKYLKEESQELLSAIDEDIPSNICEEAGDLLFILLMLSIISEEKKLFSFDQVLSTINEKLIRRHPHVFAGQQTPDEKGLKDQWERIKQAEKGKK